MEIRKFAIIDVDTNKHIVYVEAGSEVEAVKRFSLVKPLVSYYKKPGTFWQCVEVEKDAVTAGPVFNEGFFLVLETLEQAKALKH